MPDTNSANHTVNHPCARGTYEMPAQYTSEAYTVDVLLTEVRVMNAFLQALDGRTAHAFATPCGQNLAGGEDYLARLDVVPYIRDRRTMPDVVRYTSFTEASGADMIRWVDGAPRVPARKGPAARDGGSQDVWRSSGCRRSMAIESTTANRPMSAEYVKNTT